MRNLFKTSFVFCMIILFMLAPLHHVYGYGWGYKKNSQNQLPDVGKYGEIIKGHHAFYADLTANHKEIYLTFDNGYEQGYTEKILDILKKAEVPATFFVTGHYVKEEPNLVKRMVEDGHMIGNHSYHHPDFTVISKETMKKELDLLEEAVAAISDQKELVYLRPPRGTFNENTLRWADEFGYVHIFWSLAFKDWETEKQRGWQYAYDQIIEQIHPGAILLLHTVSEDNANALEKVIIHLKEEGYTFKSLDELLIKNQFIQNILF